MILEMTECWYCTYTELWGPGMLLNMDSEVDVARCEKCDSDEMEVLRLLPAVSVYDMVRCVCLDEVTNRHIEMAQSVIDLRETFYGWKNYMYCYMSLSDSSIQTVLRVVCDYCVIYSLDSTTRLEMFMKLFYSCRLIMVGDSQKYLWKFFDGKLWRSVDKSYVTKMLNVRVRKSGVGEMLQINSYIDMLLRKVASSINSNRLAPYFYCSNFDSMRDPKDRSFCMPTCLYDMSMGIVRRPLPGDLCTLSGSIDPDTSSFEERRKEMMETLTGWLGNSDVAHSYMMILAGALSEFCPRYAIVNTGEGSDGKSSFLLMIDTLFGGYSVTMPTTGPAIESRSANEATPAALSMVGKRVCITTDAGNIDRLLSSPGFKAVSGGDKHYLRRMYSEASPEAQRLKMLIIVASNQMEFVMTSINALTRIRVVRWSKKRLSEEDKGIVPAHQIVNTGRMVYRYENVFLKKFGGCMVATLIAMHMELTERNMNIELCSEIIASTRSAVCPKTILRFLSLCTDQVDAAAHHVDEESSQALALIGMNERYTAVQDLYMAYILWIRTVGRFSRTDPRTLDTFTSHLEFYHKIERRIVNGHEEPCVKNVILRPANEAIRLIHQAGGMGATLSASNRALYTDEGIYLQHS